MLNRTQLEIFLEMRFEEKGVELPEDVDMEDLVEVFYNYVEDDLNDWLIMKFSDAFLLTSGEESINWNWVRNKINSL
jgi:hypothetical protein